MSSARSSASCASGPRCWPTPKLNLSHAHEDGGCRPPTRSLHVRHACQAGCGKPTLLPWAPTWATPTRDELRRHEPSTGHSDGTSPARQQLHEQGARLAAAFNSSCYPLTPMAMQRSLVSLGDARWRHVIHRVRASNGQHGRPANASAATTIVLIGGSVAKARYASGAAGGSAHHR